MITYRATLDVSRELVLYLAGLLRAERLRIGTRKGTRKLSCYTHAVLGLRWLRDHTNPTALGRDHGVSRASAYRYLDEFLRVLADQAPDLPDALATARQTGATHVLLDGKIFRTTRYRGETALNSKGKPIEVWYSGKTRHHGGQITMVATPTGLPIWVSPVEPGRVHDLTAARTHALPALFYAAAHLGLPTLADEGYLNAGIGIHTPHRSPRPWEPALNIKQKTHNWILRWARGPVERGFALLVGRWRALRHTTTSPRALTRIVAAALVYTHFEHGWTTISR